MVLSVVRVSAGRSAGSCVACADRDDKLASGFVYGVSRMFFEVLGDGRA